MSLLRISKPCFSIILVALLCIFAGETRAVDCEKAKQYYSLGTKLSNYTERRAAFEKAVQLCPSYAEAHVNLADALENLAATSLQDPSQNRKLTNQALAEYREALKHDGRLFVAFLGLAHLNAAEGMYGEAEIALKAASHIKPEDPRVRMLCKVIEQMTLLDENLASRQTETGLITSGSVLAMVEASPSPSEILAMGPENFTVAKTLSPLATTNMFLRARLKFTNIAFDDSDLRIYDNSYLQQIDEIGRAMSSPSFKDYCFLVDCHTETKAPSPSDQDALIQLSEARARSIKQYLVGKSRIDPARIIARGFGAERPWYSEKGVGSKKRSGRVEIGFLCPIPE